MACLAIATGEVTSLALFEALFGIGEAKALEALAQEVQSGASRLMLDAAEHKILGFGVAFGGEDVGC